MFFENGLHIVEWCTSTLTILGLLVLLQFLHNVGLIIREHFKKSKKNFTQKYGKWAVITGCTNGIGKCYSYELAKAGMNIVLISRNVDKLNAVAKDIEKKYGVETNIIQADYTEGRAIYKTIASRLEGKEIGILVNNVGITGDSPKWFEKQSDDEIWDLINVNVASVPAMVKIVLPSMIKRRSGCIINVSSLAACANLAVAGLYGGSKAFVDVYSQNLCSDLSRYGIEVQTLLPSFVATDMLEYSDLAGRPSLLSPSASIYTNSAVSTIGQTKRTSGFWVHNLMKLFLENSLTRWISVFSSNVIWKRIMLEKEKSEEHKKYKKK